MSVVSSPSDNNLSGFDPIDLAQMDRVRLMDRVDTKFVFNENQLGALLGGLHDDYRVLEVDASRKPFYSTLYFESPDFRCYREHHNGKLNRHKVRMRAYSNGCCFLEVKTKSNRSRTVKKRIEIPVLTENLDDQSLRYIEEVTGKKIDLEAHLWTNFYRMTLVNRSSPERVTIDTQLEFRHGRQTASMPNLTVVEVKQDRTVAESPIRRCLRSLGIRPLSVSKYCLGNILLFPQLKQNLFKAKILAIHKALR